MTTLSRDGEIVRIYWDPWRRTWQRVGAQACTLVGAALCVCCTIAGRRKRFTLATAIAHAFLSHPAPNPRVRVTGTVQESNIKYHAPRRAMRRSLSCPPCCAAGWTRLRYAEYDASGELCRLFLPCDSTTALPYEVHPSGLLRRLTRPSRKVQARVLLGSVDATGRRRHHHAGLGWIYVDRALVFTFRGVPWTDVRVEDRRSAGLARRGGQQTLTCLSVTPAVPPFLDASGLSRVVGEGLETGTDAAHHPRAATTDWWSRVYAIVSTTPLSSIPLDVWRRVLGRRAMRVAQEVHHRALRGGNMRPDALDATFSPGGPLASWAPLFRERRERGDAGIGGVEPEGHHFDSQDETALYGAARVARLYLGRVMMKSQLPRCACGACLTFRSVRALCDAPATPPPMPPYLAAAPLRRPRED